MPDLSEDLPQHSYNGREATECGDKCAEERNEFSAVAEFISPFAFSNIRKWIMTVILASMTTVVTFGSSVWSSTIHRVAAQFSVSETVTILGVSLYVLGFAFGPIVWGMCHKYL